MFFREVEGGYRLNHPGEYYSKRYDKWVKLEVDFFSDGSTGAVDIFSWGWWVHDKLCETGVWADGSKVTNWQASMVLADILFKEKRYCRSVYWFIATFLLGGDKARDNGMFTLKPAGEDGTDNTI